MREAEPTNDLNICISMNDVKALHVVNSDDILDFSSKKSFTPHEKRTKMHRSETLLEIDTDPQSDIAQHVQAIVLDSLNLELHRGKLIGLIGSVGSGKSSFLQLLLGELTLESGSVEINGSISYASQEPWIFAGSVRHNILFGEIYDPDRYKVVVETCALMKEFEQLEYGDNTIIGDRGASLSNSQKARIK